MVGNKVQFAVVREDPRIESDLLRRVGGEGKVLLIGSGGCTAFTLMGQFPQASITVLDPNPAQLELIQKKIIALQEPNGVIRKALFGVGVHNAEALTANGNFESLFRLLATFVHEFVCDFAYFYKFFTEKTFHFSVKEKVFSSKYWPVAFQLFFSDVILETMFGKKAIQNAPSGSYAAYFQKVFEKGLLRSDARSNYFLHHVFLGYYLDAPDCLPDYLVKTPKDAHPLEYKASLAQEVEDFGVFDVMSFSNIFDWMEASEVALLCERVAREMKPGGWLVYRQLNNPRNLRALFGPSLQFDERLASDVHSKDRSLFYSGLHIGKKSEG